MPVTVEKLDYLKETQCREFNSEDVFNGGLEHKASTTLKL